MRVVINAAALKALDAKLAANLGNGADLLRDRIKEVISIQGPPRSAPYHAPHMDTTDLYHNYFSDLDAAHLEARVGSDLEYSAYLERGTDRMAPRPHIEPTLNKHLDDIAREICKP